MDVVVLVARRHDYGELGAWRDNARDLRCGRRDGRQMRRSSNQLNHGNSFRLVRFSDVSLGRRKFLQVLPEDPADFSSPPDESEAFSPGAGGSLGTSIKVSIVIRRRRKL